jgi:molybdopterin/thiamine biosynthesis adenylyltransferase
MAYSNSNNSWQVSLFHPDATVLEDSDTPRPLVGVANEKERVISLFLPTAAPPEAVPLGLLGETANALETQIVLHYRSDYGWLAQGGPLGGPVQVQVHRFGEIFARTPFKDSYKQALAETTVAVFGLGSVGSAMAVSLTRAGVGGMLLTDPERLAVENISRHECDLLSVGRFKVNAVADKCRGINPAIQIQTFPEDILEWPDEQLQELLTPVKALVSTTDRNQVELVVADIAFLMGKPFIHAGCYEEARGGEVFVNIRGVTPCCYGCLRGGMKDVPRNGKIDYSTARDAEDYQGEPGLDSAVKQVAMAGVQVVLSIPLRDQPDCELGRLIGPDRQYLLVGTARSEGFYRFRGPFDAFFQPLKGPRKNCPICQAAALTAQLQKEMNPSEDKNHV